MKSYWEKKQERLKRRKDLIQQVDDDLVERYDLGEVEHSKAKLKDIYEEREQHIKEVLGESDYEEYCNERDKEKRFQYKREELKKKIGHKWYEEIV